MYFWKIDKLKKDLVKQPLSESESFKYLIATTILYSFGSGIYEYIAYIDSGSAGIPQEFKFVNGNSSAGFELIPNPCSNGNNYRSTMVPNDTVLPIICFSSCTTCVPVNRFSSLENETVSLYPNPAREKVWVEFSEPSEHSLKITDLNGRETGNFRIHGEKQLGISTALYSPGLYFIIISDKNNQISSHKLIIE